MTDDAAEPVLEAVAIVGMAGRFPRAADLDAFWRNLCDGVECISALSEAELLAAGVEPARLADPAYVRAQAQLEGFDLFDAELFGFHPREAEITNPQHRLFLECAWQALEDAGYDPAALRGAVGVFASASSNLYLYDLFTNPEVLGRMGEFRVQIANEKEFLPTWVSYKLDLRGPSINVQTACSSSLVAVHLACQSLLNGECDLAVAGGVSVRGLERSGYLYQEGGIFSPDGHCRAFDAAAQGTVNGDGVGVLVLKRLGDALADGDNVQAVIRGSAVNNDGAAKMGYTAPGQEGQTRVIAEALAVAGVDPATVGYVETHGTATRLGDPIEIAALTEAFRARTRARGFCAVGSLKTSIGHLDAAAGAAGLIKAALALKHRRIPPSLHFREPNPEIDFAATPFYVNASLADWPSEGPRRAGVSSFGIGGTNAHVILEEAPEIASGPARPWQLLVWSARSEAALAAATANLARFLGEPGRTEDLADVAFTLQQGRRAFDHRRALVCRDAGEAARALAEHGGRRIAASRGPARPRPVAFLFPGQGAQRAGMTREIYRTEAVFRDEMDRCAGILRPHLGRDLREILYPEGADLAEAEARLQETEWTQPALFVVDYALARLWMSWGVQPGAMLGHSLGEYVAACLAGVLSLPDALALVAARGRLMQALPAGAMLAVPLDEPELAPLLGDELSIAALNGPGRTVVAGPEEPLAGLERRLAERGIQGRRLRTSRAFHSHPTDPLLPAFAERVRKVELRAPQIPYLSNLTGDWITDAEATDPAAWARQMRGTVRFGEGAGRLLEREDWALLEVGPGRTLSGLVERLPALRPEHRVVASLPSSEARAEPAALLEALGRLWVDGVEVDWAGFSAGERRRRVSLPTYPFERRRYLVERLRGSAPLPPRGQDVCAAEPPLDDLDEETRMPEPTADLTPESRRHERLLGALREVVHDLTGAAPEEIDVHSSFVEIGVDSLLLIQASQKLQDRFGVKVSLIQLLEELTTLDRVAAFLAGELPPDRLAAMFPDAPTPPATPEPAAAVHPPPAAPSPAPAPPAAGGPAPAAPRMPEVPAAAGALERLFAQQLQVMAQQIQALQGARPEAAAAIAPAVAPGPAPAVAPAPLPEAAAPAAPAPPPFTRYGPFQPLEVGSPGGLTPRQQAHLEELIRRYTARTAKSKEMTQAFRPVLADSRASVGFRRAWKQLVYPIHGRSSQGSRFVDVDGNEYVDLNMGFGLHFFGHSPDFVVEAIERQLRQGIDLGPQSPLAGEVAGLVCELTGMERAIFCNSGTEAVMGALRAARTFTRRNKIALFSGSYHGWFDGTLARSHVIDGRRVSVAAAPGVSPSTLAEVLVLDYDTPEALELLEAHGPELAAVLVEPVRSRTPDHQPREFLHRVRELTARSGTVLIFDEMVTGFRIHPGGAQAFFGVAADLATYGKLIAGGLPIGVVAGRAPVMDVLDGGMWSFGDDSYPRAEKTMFAGAFFKHPLTMAAARAILGRMRREGPALQQRLNARTARLAADLNAVFAAAGAPIEVVSFGSLFRFRFGREVQHPDLFVYHLIEKGVFYTHESGNCFLGTAHTEADLAHVEEAVRRSVAELQEGGFLPGPPPGAPDPRPAARREPAGVLAAAPAAAPAPAPAAPPAAAAAPSSRAAVDFSLYYFGSYEARFEAGKYDLLLAGAKWADEHGFAAIWLPERHFHAFGGLSPNPSVLAAALARETRRVHLRAGSVVMPLHHPIRVAEEWSLVDNLSQGRAGVSFASGWHANDFVFAPEAYDDRHAVTYRGIEAVRSLWRGGSLRVRDGAGAEMDASLYPLPRQREIPVWLTAASPPTYVKAGEMGVGILTNLQTQSLDDLEARLRLYREALARHGHDPASARVTLLLHTFVAPDLETARAIAREPLRAYLRTSFGLVQRLVKSQGRDIDFDKLPPADLDYLLGLAYERYITEHALIGTPESCAAVVERLIALGVTEIGCLIDFGVDPATVLAHLPDLDRLRLRFAERASPAPVPAAEEPAPAVQVREVPITETQRVLWLAAQMGPDISRAYNEPMVLRLRGPLDLAALSAALQGVVDRHGALRVSFSPDGLYQRIPSSLRVTVSETDLSGLGEPARAAQAQAWIQRMAGDPFDLERGPLLRCGVARLGRDDHYLALTLHHLVTDGHSGSIMVQELRRLYAAARRREPLALDPAPSFEEHALRLAETRDSPELAAAEAYWTELFADGAPVLELPTDRPRPRVASYAGHKPGQPLDSSLVGGLRSLGSSLSSTLFMTLLGAFGVLLHRLTGQDDLVAGAPTRDPAASPTMIGYFIHLMPLRLRANGDPGFRKYLGRVRRMLLEAQRHRAYPLNRLVEKLNPTRDLGQPILSATFNSELGGGAPQLLGLESELVWAHPGASRFDLTFNVVDQGSGLLLQVEYRSDLFDPSTIQRWGRLFNALLHAIVADPAQPVGELPLLPEEQRQQVLLEWNDAAPAATATFLHRMFEERARETPEAPAVVHGGEVSTYAELNRRANRLARHLALLGVGPDVPVGLCLERSADLVVGILGVLKAGGGYLPLDPGDPMERLAFLIEDAGVMVILTQESLMGALPHSWGFMVQIDADRPMIEAQDDSDLSAAPAPDGLAYVIYTSGSTGQPKGVMVPHRGLANLALAQARLFGVGPGSRVLQFATPSFDASVSEIAMTLASGAALHMAGRQELLPGPELLALLRAGGITTVTLPPSALAALPEGDLPDLHTLVVAGEACPVELARRWSAGRRLINAYGPTEATVCTTAHVFRPETGRLPLGMPIDGVRLLLLDRSANPVPAGVTGEIHLGGIGLARGYLNRPDLTAGAFVPDPFSAEPGARLYRTGDLARRRADGSLEFLGRLGHQVKLRGYRIELGEVESSLRRLGGVREAVVVVREDLPGGKALLAYVVPEAGAQPAAAELRESLAERLPEHMVPAHFVFLESLPLTPSGKVDRAALPAPTWTPADDFVAPRTPFEELVAGLFSEVLQADRVGALANFFELGGHSLLGTQLVLRIGEAFGLDLPVRTVFEAPTVAALAEVVARSLSTGGSATLPPIEPAPRNPPPPLSFAQERLWFLDRLEPGGAAYNIPAAVRLAGRLHRPAFAVGLDAIARRHEALRTTFREVDGRPEQVIAPELRLAPPLIDLRGLAPEERTAETARLAQEEAGRPFDLGHGPLVRTLLVQLDEEEHAALLTLHHAVSDGWSIGIFLRELAALYAAFSRDLPDPLPELPVQYADFAVWQRRWLAGEALERQLAWWRKELAGAPAFLDLPTDRPRPAVQTFRGGGVAWQAPPDLAARLASVGRQRGATLFMVLLAVFEALLSRHSGQEDVLVGSPTANRGRREVEGLIGFFVNTLVLRLDLSGAPGLSALLAQARETTLGAYANQDVPFEKLVEELRPERSLAHSPLFQVMLTLQNTPMGALELPGLTLTPLGQEGGTARFDLTLTLLETPGGLSGAWEYNRDLFDAATVERMAERFAALLAGAAEDPERPLADLPLLTAAEERQIVDWNATAAAFEEAGACLPELLAARAALHPERPAVTFAGESLTYGELSGRAGRLARRLRGLGAGPGTLVGVAMERSLEMVVAVLGVLQSGAAYLPLDPDYPAERLAFMLADSRAPVLLAGSGPAGALPEHGAEVVLLDRGWGAGATAGEAFAGGAGPDDLAYVIYTSGSTGRPKGVEISHRSLVNFLVSMRETLGLGERDALLAVTSLSFDIAALELYLPLLAGARLELVDRETAADGTRLRERLEASGATAMQATPATWRLLLQAGWPGDGRLAVLCGGEALPRDLAGELAARAGALWNLYGPTETTVWSTARRLEPPAAGEAVRVTIGRPIANTTVHLLDRRLHPVPAGTPGELYLGGAGLARGYLRRPGLTAVRFVPDPFAGEPGSRLYRTGDLARRLPDGDVEVLGRVDHQVKVRGFRIELGEIETALARHPAVSEAAVVARGTGGDERRLAAFLVARPGEEAAAPELRRFLQDLLPQPMVPSLFVPLERLPLTPNGKVDRKALAQLPLEGAGHAGGAAWRAPRTPVEELLAGIFAELLQTGPVGAEDGFFDLGGHSLLAMQLVSRVRESLGTELPVRAVFEAPTVAGLAAAVLRERGAGHGLRRPPIEPVPRDRPLPLSFAQQRLWFLDQLEPGAATYNLPAAVRLRGPLRVPVLAAALDEVVRRHESLRTTFASTPEGEPLQVVSAPAAARRARMAWIDLRALPAASRSGEASRLAGEEAVRPFDLARGPLLRAALVTLAEDEHLALLTLHHVVGDEWSLAVLVRELGVLYGALSRGDASPLPELPIQYADFAAWQRRWLAGEALEAEIAYWRERLADAPPVLDLPLDRPRPAVQTFAGASRSFRIPEALAAQLQALGRRRGATRFMTLLAAFQALLARLAGQTDVSVGTPVAGRTQIETEDLIGFFVNTLVLRTSLAGDPGAGELLQRVRETALGAYTHQDLPFEKLVEELQPERSLSHAPLFQTMFVLRTPPAGAREIPGLALEPVEVDGGIARFDLTLLMTETADGLAGTLEYNTDLFDGATAQRMVLWLGRLMDGMTAEPELRLSELPLLDEAERAQAAMAGSDAAPGSLRNDGDVWVHDRIARQAERDPEAPALVFEGASLSYGELDRRASRLAAWLAGQGVGLETRVGLCAEPSPDMIVGLLGILKAGGAYVPLDPAAPRERLALLLEDAGVSLLLTQERLLGRLDAAGVRPVCLDAEWEAIGKTPGAAPVLPSTAEGAAYVIYTSGSTGTPKGVVATHGGLANFTRAMAAALGLGPGDRMLQFASLSFDAAAVQIFPTLASGAALVLHRNPRALTSGEILELCAATGVTVLDLPAALWRQWVADLLEPGVEVPASLRMYLTGGEAVPAAALRDWARSLASGARFLSSYGPTEATVTAAAFQTRRDEVAGLASAEVPLGRPLADVRLHLLDPWLQPVPPGIPGEIAIGGAGVTRGYLHHPALTAERYVPDPWSPQPGARLYRTGDLARRLADGELQFLGRRDLQVKIRGYRIEPGEVEAAIASYPGVRETAVLVRAEPSGDRRLVAWVVPERLEGFSAEALLAALREVLPDPMVPSLVVPLAAMPLTPGGKLDRQALSRMAGDLAAPARPGERPVVAPRNELELALAHLWEELLGTRPVGVTDSFFALGGHSLLSVRLMARIRSRFGRSLPLAVLFEEPTVEHLARSLAEHGGREAGSPLVAIQPHGSRPPLFCVHPMGGEVLGYRELAHRLGPDQPFYGLQASMLAEAETSSHDTIEEMADAYLDAVRSLRPCGPYLLAGWSFGGLVAFEMARLLELQGEEVALLALLDTPAPGLEEGGAEFDEAAVIANLAREQARQHGRELALTADTLRGLPLDEKLERAARDLREVEVFGDEMDVPVLRRFLAGYRSRNRAAERYRGGRYMGRIDLFRPREIDPEQLRSRPEAWLRTFEDPTFGWSGLAPDVRVHFTPGHHETMVSEPNVRELAGRLRACIAEAKTGQSDRFAEALLDRDPMPRTGIEPVTP